MLDPEVLVSRGLVVNAYRNIDEVRSDRDFESRTKNRLEHAASLLRACRDGPVLFRCAVHGGYSALQLRTREPALIDWREDAICPECGINARMRLGIVLLDAACASIQSPAIYLTEQASFTWLAARKLWPQVVGSEFFADLERTTVLANFVRESTGDPQLQIRIEDLTALGFSDRCFDAVGSFDVLEHVPDYRRALRECARVLRPGGRLVLSAPFDMAGERNVLRAQLREDGSVEHLLAPEYHADSISPAGVLCFHHFGWELLEDCRAAGFSDASYLVAWSPIQALLGPHLGILVAQR